MTKRSKGRISKARIVSNIFICIFIAVFVISGTNVVKLLAEDRSAEQAYKHVRRQVQESAYRISILPASVGVGTDGENADQSLSSPQRTSVMDFTALKDENKDIIAWLHSEGTSIDYPVLHGEDNEYYLRHLYTGETNRAGSLFVDYRNTGMFTDKNTVIYGHNMSSDEMFHSLCEYKMQDYYDAFPTMQLLTPNGDYTVEIFCGTVEDGNFEFVRFDFKDNEDFLDYINAFQSRSTFVSNVQVEPTDQIVTLCTCSYERNNARYVLMGRLVIAQ